MAINEAAMAPTLAIVEQQPIAELRTTVGKSSGVKVYTPAYTDVIAPFVTSNWATAIAFDAELLVFRKSSG